jgi:hypothetical protein
LGRPIWGIGLSGFHLIFGCGLTFIPVFSSAAVDERTAWIHLHPTHRFQVKLPSSGWREVPQAGAEPKFVHAMPAMQAQVLTVVTGQSEADFQAAVKKHLAFLESNPNRRSPVQQRQGMTSKGNPYLFATTTDEPPSGGTPLFVATSVVLCKERGLLVFLLFEGYPRMASRVGRDSEMKSFQTASEYILLSVE